MKAIALVCCLALSSAAAAETEERIDQTQEDDGSADRVGRVMAEIGGAVLGGALPNLLWIPFVFAGGGSSLGPIMLAVAVSLEPISIPTGAWLVHRKMRGQGYWASAFGGTMVGAVIGVGLVAVYGAASDWKGEPGYTALAVAGACVIGAAATALALELHHDVRLNASLAPLPGGAMGAISFRF